MNETPKLVASTTLERVEWKNASLIAGDVAALAFLSGMPGKDISISGSGTLVKSLLLAELIDELRLLVAPIVVGRGARLFDEGSEPRGLELIASSTLRTAW